MRPKFITEPVTNVTTVLFMAGALLSFGCTSKKDTVERYSREGTAAQQTQRGTDAEAYFLSAVDRSRALGPEVQSDTLLKLGTFYREQARFREAARPLAESLQLGLASGKINDAGLARRRIELAKAYAVLNRWAEGRDLLRDAAPGLGGLTADEAAGARELIEVYRLRLAELGIGSEGLP
jgi:hypothetical protein